MTDGDDVVEGKAILFKGIETKIINLQRKHVGME